MAENTNGTDPVISGDWTQYVGPGGEVVTVFMLFLPILFVVVATLSPHPIPTTVSLPLSAVLMYLVRLAYLDSDVINTTAALVSGFPEVLTPLTIICGAIYLFNIMETTGCMPWIMRELKILSKSHPVAEFMLIGYCFAYLVEGASGFGTPAALAAPMLAQLGHNKRSCVVAVLLTNTMATVFGAVGTPIWYGFGALVDAYYRGEETDTLTEIGFQSAVALGTASLIIPLLAASQIIPFNILLNNIIFFYLSLMSVMIPVVVLSLFSYEFPTILGGIIGLGITAILVTFQIGLRDINPDLMNEEWQICNKRGALYNSATSRSEVTDAHPIVLHESTVDIESDIIPEIKNEEEENDGSKASLAGSVHSITSMTSRASRKESSKSQLYATTAAVTTTRAVKSAFVPDAQVDDLGSALQNNINRCPEEFDDDFDDDTVIYKLKPRETGGDYVMACLLRTFPITGTVLLLILTRIPAVTLKELLTSTETYLGVQMGTFCWFQISPNLKMLFNNILTDPTVNSKYETLYVPGLIPFFIISWITCVVYWEDMKSMKTNPFKELVTLAGRVSSAAIALLGGLMLVGLIRNGGYGSPAYLLGSIISGWVGGWWFLLAPFLGALGSFFSGSTAVSNLTFGEVQYVAAVNAGYNPTTILALQAFGASMGNAICINNVIAARTVIGLLDVGEGKFISKTGPVVIAGIISTTLLMYLYFVVPGDFYLSI
eukprot:CFRG8331T1